MAATIAALEHSLVWGNGERPLEMDGLLRLAGEPTRDVDAFYARVAAEPTLMLLEPTAPEWIGEGELPAQASFTIAMREGAVVWKQLLPATRIPLVSTREGRFTVAIDRSGPPEPKYPTTPEVQRSCIVAYGYLELRDPSGLFVLAKP